MTILDYYKKERQRFLENCIQCGSCAAECPILPYTDLNETSSQDIQSDIFNFIDNGFPTKSVYTKAFACMECFKCTTDICPEDLNPLLINEIIKGEYISKKLASSAFSDSQQVDSTHRVLASIQLAKPDYQRIFTASHKKQAKYLFFPGCNVYFQPEKILNALAILDAIGDDYAFLPGLDYCCGDNHLFFGKAVAGSNSADELVAAIRRFQPETVLLWCPTCSCRFDKYILPSSEVTFNIRTFPQYLAENMDKLPLTETAAKTVTLHEACKSAHTGLDLQGPREVLRQLPGVTLREMRHHGRDTRCCGSGAICWFPEEFAQFRDDRMKEAEQTGADCLVTVCHFCNQVFADQESHYGFSVSNYVNLVAEAMGIHREDKFKMYAVWRNLDRILKDAEDNILESPFEKKRIVEVIQSVFIQ